MKWLKWMSINIEFIQWKYKGKAMLCNAMLCNAMNSNEIQWAGSFMLIMLIMRKKEKAKHGKQKGKLEKAFAKLKGIKFDLNEKN